MAGPAGARDHLLHPARDVDRTNEEEEVSDDKVLRSDLLAQLRKPWANIDGVFNCVYRGYRAAIRSDNHKNDAILFIEADRDVHFEFPFCADMPIDPRELLQVLRDLDYLIDVLDAVDEPALKES
jgi:hypothetical protein